MTSLIHVQGLKGTIIMKRWECILVYEIRALEYNISNFPSFNTCGFIDLKYVFRLYPLKK